MQSGESLWEITAQHLGAGASPAAISAAWPAVYQANRAVIGGDPNLIRPGQVLVFPSG